MLLRSAKPPPAPRSTTRGTISDQKLAQLSTKADLEILGDALLERLRTELAHQLQALQETVSTQISAMNAKRADLPARVRHLETAVLAPRPH